MTHTLVLPSGKTILYRLERRQRRSVGLKISSEGLIVHAPIRIATSLLQEIIAQKANWIEQKLLKFEANQIPPLQWRQGEQLLLLGNPLVLDISSDQSPQSVRQTVGMLSVSLAKQTPAEIARKVIQWYKKQATVDFSRRLEIFAAKLGIETPKLFISNAKTRWGSCNSKREIRLNWRLLQAPPHLINYVVCHELAHLKEMNHSTKFWAVVGQLYPDYKSAEKELKHWSPKLHVM